MTEKLVPREPTNAMLHSAYQECEDFIDEHGDGEASNLDNCQWNDMMAAAWRAMFDTAKPTDALSILYGASVEICTQLRQRAETAESALAACRGDAERYRWLRSDSAGWMLRTCFGIDPTPEHLSDRMTMLDAQVDAAIRASKEATGETGVDPGVQTR